LENNKNIERLALTMWFCLAGIFIILLPIALNSTMSATEMVELRSQIKVIFNICIFLGLSMFLIALRIATVKIKD